MAITAEDLKLLKARFASLVEQYKPWMTTHVDIRDYIQPRMGNFTLGGGQQPNAGDKRGAKILDPTATRALRTLAAGMHSGMTAPTRPWFKLATVDRTLAELDEVRGYLEECEVRLYHAYAVSNFYTACHQTYGEVGGFGNGVLFQEDDLDTYLRFTSFTAGEYAFTCDHRGVPDTFVRKIHLTARQMEQKYGRAALNESAKTALEKTPDTYFPVIHILYPRAQRDPSKIDNLNMPFADVYFQEGAQEAEILRESGFNEMPAHVMRWEVAGQDAWARGPGEETLPDVKMLQALEKKFLKALDKQIDPPMKTPSGFKGQLSLLPGATNPVDSVNPDSLGPLLMIKPDLATTYTKMQDVRRAIKEGFFNDLFRMLEEAPNGMTATEVMERKGEKVILLGPVIERALGEFYSPLIVRSFGILNRAGLLPPPPKSLAKQPVKIEYTSILAQAQKATGTRSIKGLCAFVLEVAPIKQDILDTIDWVEAVQQIGDLEGVPNKIVRSAEDVAKIQQSRAEGAAQQAEQANQMQQAQAGMAGVKVAKDLAGIPVEGNTALDAVTRQAAGPEGEAQ